jgi:hypothetical protein
MNQEMADTSILHMCDGEEKVVGPSHVQWVSTEFRESGSIGPVRGGLPLKRYTSFLQKFCVFLMAYGIYLIWIPRRDKAE